jgi:NTP pyrophosphatase (non-canonical NTP hydrolase)
MDINTLQTELREFMAERNWHKYHSSKNLAMALSVEASELVEIFQWLDFEESKAILDDPKGREHVEEEVGDIFAYLLRFCDVTGIDPEQALRKKMVKNALKYPVEESVRLNKFVKK